MLPRFRFLAYALLFVSVTTLVHAQLVNANEQSQEARPGLSCPVANAAGADGLPVYFSQHHFPDGAQDLAIAKSQPGAEADIKRVTFGGDHADTCRYKYLAIARGGDWGWHLTWVEENDRVLRYARMDGEAWVTSPVKKIAVQARTAGQPYVFTAGMQLWVVWVEASDANRIYAVHSDDEGRSWHDAELLAETAAALSDLKLVEIDNKPYLAATGLAQPLSLAGK